MRAILLCLILAGCSAPRYRVVLFVPGGAPMVAGRGMSLRDATELRDLGLRNDPARDLRILPE